MNRRMVGVGVGLTLLAGCISGFKQPAPVLHDYLLDYTSPAVSGHPLPVTVTVPVLGVAAVFDRDAIIYRSDAYSTGTYFYHRWSTQPGAMVADLLARDLAASGLYRAVLQGPSVLPTDYQINGQIEAIEELATGRTCTAAFRMRVTLIRAHAGKDNPVLVHTTYSGEEPTPCNSPAEFVAAMSRVLERISTQLQNDAYAAIARDSAP